jgi:nicotinamide riboside transporter PnuC
MPNRGELPIPATRAASAAKSRTTSYAANADADAWAVIAFCAIGVVLTFAMALASLGASGLPVLTSQMPWG